jgi:predicted DNA-binding antitoxin AbrB/MazE fold protein
MARTYNGDMSDLIPAVFESGVFRPLVPLGLNEGDVVNLLITADAASTEKAIDTLQAQRTSIASLLAEVESLPPEGSAEVFSGRDHDAAHSDQH